MDKLKIFGIGAAVLMVLIALAPTVISDPDGMWRETSPVPPSLDQERTKFEIISDFFDSHSIECAVIDTYLEEIDMDYPPEEFPVDIQELIESLADELDSDLRRARPPVFGSRHEQPHGYDGKNGMWITAESIEMEAPVYPHDEEDYIGHMIALDNDVTELLRQILESYGAGAAIVYLGTIVAIIYIPFGIILSILLWEYKDEILDLIPTINNGFGIRIWIFDSVNHYSFIWNIYYIDAQPGLNWHLPYPWVQI